MTIDAVETTPAVRHRTVEHTDLEDLDKIARLHMELLSFGPFAALGEDFVREICYAKLIRDGVLHVVLSEVDGNPAGFVAYTGRSVTFHRTSLRRHLFAAGSQALRSLLQQPSRLLGLLRAMRVLSTRRGESDRLIDPLGEIVSIAVRPKYLALGFTHAMGLRLSEELVRLAAAALRENGVGRMRMLVDAGNSAPLLLYHRLGARFERYVLGGRASVEVWFDLSDAKLRSASR